MKISIVVFVISLLFPFYTSSQSLSADQLIEKSINYHDPDGLLMNSNVLFEINEPRPDEDERITKLHFYPKEDLFKSSRMVKGVRYNASLQGTEAKMHDELWDPVKEKNLSEDDIKVLSRLSRLKNYYHYLWFLPMKLKDKETIIHPEVKEADFFGQSLLEIKVTYEKEVGEDIWYFYFDPSSYALSGYRFYHDESANDGEYILLKDELNYENIKLPKTRKWYTHKEDKFLGYDDLISIKFIKSK